MIQLYALVFVSTALGDTSKIDIPCLNGLMYIHGGENINLNCFFSSVDPSKTAWFRQTPGEKPLLIASAFHVVKVAYHNDFDKSGRLEAFRGKSSFNLSISNVEPSDSATYYCSVTDYTDNALLSDCTVLVLKGSSSSLSAILQPPVSDPVELGGDTTLQCSILTDASAGDHSVYWFRHGSGESHPGIIYTHGNRSDECKKSSETDSPTQSCVYKLPKRNLSLSDAGTYYCAVLMCGQIIFGSGTKLDFVEKGALDPTVLGLAASNIIIMAVVLFLCRKLHNSHKKDAAEDYRVQINQAEDTDVLNYAALSFAQSSSSRRSRTKNSSDQPVYAQ
uniref:Ig-like domain-containing protein n=1 Tax=Pygocentrus nattereri TaxID=42514 RepID=A0A3B4E5C0_PYGNA